METEKILSSIAAFDPQLYNYFQDELQKQKYALSLMPEENYTSPLSAYLEGSILSNTSMTHHDEEAPAGLESITVSRVNKLYGSEHASIRTSNIAAASRVVFYSLLKKGDTVLSLDNRKKDHCNSESLQFNFVKFSIDPHEQRIKLDQVEKLANEHKPKIIIFSPVNYPRIVDYKHLSDIAKSVGAYMWFDICQNAGLVAAKEIPSPVPYADVVTFSTHDSLQGPQGCVILCRKKMAKSIDNTVITTGHFALKKNILAALAIVFKEAATEKYGQYCHQVILNAKSLQKGLEEEGLEILCGGTDTNLVLLNLTKLQMSCNKACSALRLAGIMTKPTVLTTAEDKITFDILRLSSLILTTRGLKEAEMYTIGHMIGIVLKNHNNPEKLDEIRQDITDIAIQYPLFSDEWLAAKAILNPVYSGGNLSLPHELAAERKKAVLKKILGFIKK
ncbi:serine hydroxymethyltransferase [Pectinatus sottacetonis]|uniref:serine hydroxymethyltransferase n=1 Tax=Pectinatus sottacetonis TaxID=1002795 RepID=UPI0018C4769C|nr:aminotransferase class V-fold PLP-dependent enzyme [Pectinatus sottacetonis]